MTRQLPAGPLRGADPTCAFIETAQTIANTAIAVANTRFFTCILDRVLFVRIVSAILLLRLINGSIRK
jgi:hypothetical protein